MKLHMNRHFSLVALAIGSLFMAACHSDKHTRIEAKPGMTVVCSECYDEAVKVWRFTQKGQYEETRKVHHCPACKAAMSTYVENGVPKIKCAGCAPAGLECDKCLPSGSLAH